MTFPLTLTTKSSYCGSVPQVSLSPWNHLRRLYELGSKSGILHSILYDAGLRVGVWVGVCFLFFFTTASKKFYWTKQKINPDLKNFSKYLKSSNATIPSIPIGVCRFQLWKKWEVATLAYLPAFGLLPSDKSYTFVNLWVPSQTSLPTRAFSPSLRKGFPSHMNVRNTACPLVRNTACPLHPPRHGFISKGS